jgi:hypothetical protein
MWTRLGLLLLFLPSSGQTHTLGTHKVCRLNVLPERIEGLLTLEFEGGKRSALLRASADRNRDGQLSLEERQALRARLERLALKAFFLRLGKTPIPVEKFQSKLDLQDRFQVLEHGMSLALFFSLDLPQGLGCPTQLIVQDRSPDGSHVRIEVSQSDAEGRLQGPMVTRELKGKADRFEWELPSRKLLAGCRDPLN